MIGNKIKMLRKASGLTQSELGEKLGVIKQTISSWENGISSPGNDSVTAMAKIFDVSTDYLLGLSDTKSPYGITAYYKNRPKLHEEIGNSISYWIGKSDMDSAELAEAIGISKELLYDIRSGGELPSLEVLIKLSEICEVSTDCLLGLREKSRTKIDGEFPFRFDPEISRRLKEQAAAMGEDYAAIASILGIEESEVHNFFEYGFVPNIMVFAQIVEHFLMSADYLLNRTDSTLTVLPDEVELLRSYRALNAKSKTIALSRIYELEREEALVAANDRRYLDSEGKSWPSNGTEGGMVG